MCISGGESSNLYANRRRGRRRKTALRSWLPSRPPELSSPPEPDFKLLSVDVFQRPEQGWTHDGRFNIETVAVNGQAVGVQFRLLSDLVSVSRTESVSAGLFDRATLGRWLADALAGYPMHDLAVDEVRLTVSETGRVALSLAEGGLAQPAIAEWDLSPTDARTLLQRI